jgi:hypothetical protein
MTEQALLVFPQSSPACDSATFAAPVHGQLLAQSLSKLICHGSRLGIGQDRGRALVATSAHVLNAYLAL